MQLTKLLFGLVSTAFLVGAAAKVAYANNPLRVIEPRRPSAASALQLAVGTFVGYDVVGDSTVAVVLKIKDQKTGAVTAYAVATNPSVDGVIRSCVPSEAVRPKNRLDVAVRNERICRHLPQQFVPNKTRIAILWWKAAPYDGGYSTDTIDSIP